MMKSVMVAAVAASAGLATAQTLIASQNFETLPLAVDFAGLPIAGSYALALASAAAQNVNAAVLLGNLDDQFDLVVVGTTGGPDLDGNGLVDGFDPLTQIAFSTEWVNTREAFNPGSAIGDDFEFAASGGNIEGLVDGDFIGVTAFNDADADGDTILGIEGTNWFQHSDADGSLRTTFGPVDVTDFENVTVSFLLHINASEGHEELDHVQVTLVTDAGDVELFDNIGNGSDDLTATGLLGTPLPDVFDGLIPGVEDEFPNGSSAGGNPLTNPTGQIELLANGLSDAGSGVFFTPNTFTRFTIAAPAGATTVSLVFYSGSNGAAERFGIDDIRVEGVEATGGCNAADIAEPFNTLNIFDIFGFFNAFGAGTLATADIDGNGSLNIFDIFGFFAAFGAGCP